jgi:hypothetical protein
LSASNSSTQNWAFEPITDQDQLRRLYDLYRFAVSGNNSTAAQDQLAADYPLPYKTTAAQPGGQSATAPDPNGLVGPNCVLCDAKIAPIGLKCSSIHRAEKLYYRPELEGVCLKLNPRLLPGTTNLAWLRWTNLGEPHQVDEGRAARHGDLFIGQRGVYRLYVDQSQQDRFAEFALLITAAANSSPSPTSAASSAGNAPKAKGAIATPTGILLSQ